MHKLRHRTNSLEIKILITQQPFLDFFSKVAFMVLLMQLATVKPQGISIPTTTTTTPSPLNDGVCSVPSLNPCVPAAVCSASLPVFGEAICTCPQGYGGDGKRQDVGGFGCYDIDECLSGTHTCNPVSQVCFNYNGGFSCQCSAGYQYDNNNVSCVDIDECSTGANICPLAETMCFNTPGSYECVCRMEGMIFDKDLGACRPIDKCNDLGGSMNPCAQLCVMQGNETICSCETGYQLNPDLTTCDDVDECALGLHSCDPNGIISKCTNMDGAYRCDCNPQMGYSNAPDGRSCINLNECATDATACGTGAMCCKDLDPPQRFACLVPGEELYEPITPMNTDFNNYFQVLQRESRKEIPYKSSLQESQPWALPRQVDKLFPATAYIGDPSLSRDNDFQMTARHIIDNNCFQFETVFIDKDIHPVFEQVPFASSCQNICSSQKGCMFYSYNVVTQECHLKATSFTPYFDTDYVSGTGDCSYAKQFRESPDKGLFSLGLTALEPVQMRSSGGLFGRFLEKNIHEYDKIREGVLPAEMCGGDSKFHRHCVIAGNMGWAEIEELTHNIVPYIFTTITDKQVSIKPTVNLDQDVYTITGMSVSKRHEKPKRNLMGLGLDLGLGELMGSKGRRFYSNNFGVLDNLMPINLFSPSCPEDYIYSSDVARELRKDKTMDVAMSFFTNEKNGTVTPKDPADLKNSLVSNTNYLANELARWYIELASAPVDIATAAFVGTPTNGYTNGSSGLILTEETIPGGVEAGTPTGITEERKKLNSALLTTLGFLSVIGGTAGGGGSTARAYGF